MMMKKGIIKEVNTRFIGTKDPNSLLDNKYIKDSELGDFFFMLKGGEQSMAVEVYFDGEYQGLYE